MSIIIKLDQDKIQVLDDKKGTAQIVPITLEQDNKLFLNHLPGFEPLKNINGFESEDMQVLNTLDPSGNWCSVRSIMVKSQLPYPDVSKSLSHLMKKKLVACDFFYRRL